MTRSLTLLLVVLALLAPGIVQRVGGAERQREHPPDRGPDRHLLHPSTRPEHSAGQTTPEGGACQPTLGGDISGLLDGQGSGTWMTVSADCSGTPGCNHYFHLDCPAGELVQASFCHHGGSASWNTALTAVAPNHQDVLFCNDDSCGQQSDMVWTVPFAGNHHVRIGGANGESGLYTLAVNIPTNCAVVVVIPVELQSFEVG